VLLLILKKIKKILGAQNNSLNNNTFNLNHAFIGLFCLAFFFVGLIVFMAEAFSRLIEEYITNKKKGSISQGYSNFT